MNITYIIIGVTVLISLAGFSNPRLQARLMMNPFRIRHNNEYYRFLSSGFIHGNYTHLFFNMFSFYFFGSAIETIFSYRYPGAGGLYYILLYLLAIVVSDMPTYFKQHENPAYNSLGASGGVAAIIFAFIVFQPLQDICFFIGLCMPGFIVGLLYVIFSYYQGRKSNDSINHDAHLYGSLFGLVFCLVIDPHSFSAFFSQILHWRPFH